MTEPSQSARDHDQSQVSTSVPDLVTTAKRLSLRPKEAAKALGISERLLWTKTNCGEIPHCRIGRAVLYPVHLLEEYLEKQAKGGDA